MSAAAEQLRLMYNSANMTAKSLTDRLGELQENWKGSSSDLMADAVERYLQWLTKHSRQILETAYVIDFLAYVYEETRHKVVPPATIANNREEVQADREQRGRGKHSSNRRTRCTISAVPGPKYRCHERLSKYRPVYPSVSAPMAGAAADLRGRGRVGPEGRGGTCQHF